MNRSTCWCPGHTSVFWLVLTWVVCALPAQAARVNGSMELVPRLNPIGITVDRGSVPDAASWMTALGGADSVQRVERYDRATGLFEFCELDSLGMSGSGCSLPLVPGEGWLVTANQATTVDYDVDIDCPRLDLLPGINLVSFPCVDSGVTSYTLLPSIGDPDVLTTIQGFDRLSGRWISTIYDEFGQPAGDDFAIDPARAYLVYADGPFVQLPSDSDADGLSDAIEDLLGTIPTNPDSDVDTLLDGNEIALGTDPLSTDTDGDGLDDATEVNTHGTNPLSIDTDGDGFTDAEELAAGADPLRKDSVPPPPGADLTKITTSPAHGEGEVAITRETVIRFTRALSATTVVDESLLFAEFGGEPLGARIHTAPDRRSVTLFYDNPLPASARVRVTFNGDTLLDSDGRAVDVDNDGQPGGIALIDFDTLNLTSIPGTAVCGRVFASELIPGESGMSVNVPLEGVTITVDGLESSVNAVTDALGNFRLDNAPVGEFFVHIDGRTASNGVPPGAYYPFVGKAWQSTAGEEINIGNIYLPLVQPGTLQPVSDTADTSIFFVPLVLNDFPEFAGVQLTVPAGSLFADDGTTGGSVGIAPVPPDRIPGELPPEFSFPLVITVQTDGATNFNEPVQACFPNLPHPDTNEVLGPGEKSALWSFNHDTGRFEVAGPMTVSTDGTLVCTDPGSGIKAPGWHGVQPGVVVSGGQITSGSGITPGAITPFEKGTAATPPAAPHCPTCKGDESEEDNPVDPVYLFSGEFYETTQDLKIKGRGLDFVWSRKYRSKIGLNTPQGNGWDYSYNIYIEQQDEDIDLFDGNSRRDTYERQPDGSWGKAEFFRKLIRNANGTYTLIFEDNGTWKFYGFDGSPEQGRIASIVDRNGNTISFAYDGNGRLVTVTDTLDRDISIGYNTAGLISTVTDFAGRVVRYEYYDGIEPGGNAGDLKSATSPAVTGTPNGNDFPAGKTVSYTYSTGFADERLNHNLLTITDGRRNDPNDPTIGEGPYLVNSYSAATDPTSVNFDRVVRQIWGGDQIDVVYLPQVSTEANDQAIMRTIVNDRMGNVKEYFWDNRNRAVIEREYTGRANPVQPTTNIGNRPTVKLRTSDPDYFETRYTWNDDSQMTRKVHPNGNVTEYVYESDLNPNASARSRGNLRILRRLPGSHTPSGDQPFIQELFEYHPDFAAYDDGRQFVTKYTDGRGNVTRYQYDSRGNRIHTQHRLASIVEDFEYNEFGQLTKLVHPDNGNGWRRGDVFEYYTHAEDDDQEGYLKALIIDANGFALTSTFEYDLVGNVVRAIDPRGNDTQFVVNELDQVVRTISREVTDGSGIRHQIDIAYDANNNIVRKNIQNVEEDGVTGSNAEFSYTYAYEVLDHVIRIASEVSEDKSIVTEYDYDRNRNQILVRTGEATNGNQPLNTLRKEYDERDLLFREIRAEGDAGQSTTQYDYDENENEVLVLAGLEDEPRTQRYSYDGYNRVVSHIDPMGNEQSYRYDANHNVVARRLDGEVLDVTGGQADNVRLEEYTYLYDSVDREIRQDVAFFDTESQAPIDDGQSTQFSFYNDNSQLVRLVDDNGHQAVMRYDTANRRQLLSDHKGNSLTFSYDENSNVVQVTELNKSDLGTPDETFVTTYAYDNLDRTIKKVDNVGNTIEYAYDSRNNMTRSVDALRPTEGDSGNISRYSYDGINRLISITRVLTDDGTGAGAVIGSITTTQRWDDNSRLIGQTDDNGNETAYTYDALDRRITTRSADSTENNYRYDVHHNVIGMTDANGNVVTNSYDLLDRLTDRVIAPGPNVSDDTTFERYQYDGLSRLIHAEDDDSLVTHSFDSLSRLTRETLNGQTLTAAFDGVGNQLVTDYPGGRRVFNTFDALNRKQTISDRNGVIARYDYLGPKRTQQREYANDTQSAWTYDGVKRIIGTTHTFDPSGAAVVFDSRAYTWDQMYNKTSRQDLLAGGTLHEYRYDSVYRLTQSVMTPSVGDAETILYDLDGVGNRAEVTGGLDAGLYQLDPALPEPADKQTNQYTTTPFDERLYDENGNLVSVNAGSSNQRNYSYDYRNQQVGFANQADGTTARYRYDALGRRTEKVVDGGSATTTRYFYDGWRVVEEQDASNSTTATYVYGRYIDEVLSMRRDGMDYFYHADDLYNVMEVTDAAGAVVEKYEYGDFGSPEILDPQGNVRTESAIANPYLFTGRRFDSETEYYYFRTRYLDPRIGRFTTRDTIGIWTDPGNLGNGYTYAGNNPWTMLDPFGDEFFPQDYGQFTQGVFLGMGDQVRETIAGFGDLAHQLSDPIGFVNNVSSGIKQLINELYGDVVAGRLDKAALTVLRTSFPLLLDLVEQWHCLSDLERGRLIGRIIVEHGSDLVMAVATAGAGAVISGTGKAVKLTKKLVELAEKAKKIAKKAGKRLPPGCSFTGDTEIATEHGEVNIDDINIGDVVWAWDEDSKRNELATIVRLFRRNTEEILLLKAGSEIIETTPEHPFWVVGRQWVPAGQLVVGDSLYSFDGRFIDVQEIKRERGSYEVFNFEVDRYHNYFTSNERVLVHNKNCKLKEITKSSRRRVKRIIKNLSDNRRKNNGLTQKKTDRLRRIVERAGGNLRNDGPTGVKGSSAGKPHVQTEGLGKSIDSRHIWTQEGVQ